MQKIRILVADDHPAFREGLVRCLREQPDLDVIAQSADGEEALRLARELQPDVAIMGVSLPKMSGIEAARRIRPLCPGTALLMLSAFHHQSYIVASLRAGAAGYLPKTAPLCDVISAVRLLHAGDGVFDLKVAGRVLYQLGSEGHEGTGDVHGLGERKLEIVSLAARGMSNKEIAGELGISERTVQTHLAGIFRKLNVGSRTEAVLQALRQGWITLDDLPPADGMP